MIMDILQVDKIQRAIQLHIFFILEIYSVPVLSISIAPWRQKSAILLPGSETRMVGTVTSCALGSLAADIKDRPKGYY